MFKRLIMKVDDSVEKALRSKKADYLNSARKASRSQPSSFKKSCKLVFDDCEDIESEKIENVWFPNVPCHVFISHSHGDEELAVALAGLLKEEYGLDCFVDSVVWKHEDALFDILETKYNVDENGDPLNDKDISKANREFCVLLTNCALTKMIDKCDCILFLETKKAMPRLCMTYSPWIYSEISTANRIRVHRPFYCAHLREGAHGKLKLRRPIFRVETSRFLHVTLQDFKNSKKENGINDTARFLDGVYQSAGRSFIGRPRVGVTSTASPDLTDLIRYYMEKKK